MHFDIVFLDVTSPNFYDSDVLNKKALGGTEATVIRVADALSALGLRVCVLQSRIPYFEPIMGNGTFYMHSDDASGMTTRHYVQVRYNNHPDIFKGSKKYLWLHDCINENNKPDLKSIQDENMTVIGVSRWHKKNIQQFLPGYENINYIYNPVPDEVYINAPFIPKYDHHAMVWISSPHKGLGPALKTFDKIRAKNDRMQLWIFNPGYHQLDNEKLFLRPGICVYGPTACRAMWPIIQKAMCVFYPSDWPETFGMFASEANAIGTPVLSYGQGALKEITSENQVVELNQEEEFINKILNWSENGRPTVYGKDEFKLSEVIVDWVKLLAK